jgi:hypothetical protein
MNFQPPAPGGEVPNPKEYPNFNIQIRGNTRCSLEMLFVWSLAFGSWDFRLSIADGGFTSQPDAVDEKGAIPRRATRFNRPEIPSGVGEGRLVGNAPWWS